MKLQPANDCVASWLAPISIFISFHFITWAKSIPEYPEQMFFPHCSFKCSLSYVIAFILMIAKSLWNEWAPCVLALSSLVICTESLLSLLLDVYLASAGADKQLNNNHDRPRDAFIFWQFKMYDKHWTVAESGRFHLGSGKS